MSDSSVDIVSSGNPEPGPRQRMILHAADLIGRDGVAATSIGDVIAASSAPRGSIYHHFPGGKTQLMTEAVRYSGEFIAGRISDQRPDSAAEVVTGIGGVWRRMLVDSDFQFGCPVLAGGLARRSEPGVADESAEIFRSWFRMIAGRLGSEGVAPDRADSLASLIVAAVEGAVGLCLTQRSVAPLDQVIDELARMCEDVARA